MHKLSILKYEDTRLSYEISEAILEIIYAKYIVLTIPSKYIDDRFIINIYDQTYKLKFKNEGLQKDFELMIQYVKSTISEYEPVDVCNCFRGLLCINCLFINTNKLSIKNDNIIFSSRIDLTPQKPDPLFDNPFVIYYTTSPSSLSPPTLSIPLDQILQEVKEDTCVNNILRKYMSHYKDLLYFYTNKYFDIKIDLNLFFTVYSRTPNEDLYLMNECILDILSKCCDTDYINMFFMYFGEYIKHLKVDTNLIRLFLGLFHISEFRVREVIVQYDVLDLFIRYEYTKSTQIVYLTKLFCKLDDFFIKRYFKNNKFSKQIKEFCMRNDLQYLINMVEYMYKDSRVPS
ncbi:hypothetical protein P3W45_001239 [Vairimorpha bombi]|jgi:hypothetical protein